MVSKIVTVSGQEMRQQRRDPSVVSLNRMPDLCDWRGGSRFSDILWEIRCPVVLHRKSWEYGICIEGLEKLGVVKPDAKAIAVGAGYETPLFYFANKIEKMVATDLYENPNNEGRPEMLTNPAAFSPFEYRRDHLEVYRMSGTELLYADNTFDFCFCLSSIEHFGSRQTQKVALNEMKRVLKPGGVACVITEIIINGEAHDEYFLLEEMNRMFLTDDTFRLVGGEPDYTISEVVVDLSANIHDAIDCQCSPHIVLRDGQRYWTSFSMFLQKL